MIEDDIEQLRQDVSMALDAADSDAISKILNGINVTQISNLLDSLPSQQRDLIWPQIDPAGSALFYSKPETKYAITNSGHLVQMRSQLLSSPWPM